MPTSARRTVNGPGPPESGGDLRHREPVRRLARQSASCPWVRRVREAAPYGGLPYGTIPVPRTNGRLHGAAPANGPGTLSQGALCAPAGGHKGRPYGEETPHRWQNGVLIRKRGTAMFLPEDFDLHQWELTCHSLADNVLWRQVMEGNLRESARFEIHCWTEETEELQAALRFGAPADTGWQWGAGGSGGGDARVRSLSSFPAQAANDGGYNKMTPLLHHRPEQRLLVGALRHPAEPGGAVGKRSGGRLPTPGLSRIPYRVQRGALRGTKTPRRTVRPPGCFRISRRGEHIIRPPVRAWSRMEGLRRARPPGRAVPGDRENGSPRQSADWLTMTGEGGGPVRASAPAGNSVSVARDAPGAHSRRPPCLSPLPGAGSR